MWDNRESKRNPKQPDYKCKDQDCGKAVWLDKKRKQHDDDLPSQESHPNGGQPSPEYWDARNAAIERQHSQEMALRFFALAGKLPSTPALREMISWFQRDIRNSPDKQSKPAPEPEDEEIPF